LTSMQKVPTTRTGRCRNGAWSRATGARLSSSPLSKGLRQVDSSDASLIMASRRAVFLDRDGTLIEDVGYPSDPDKVRLLPGVVDGLQALRKKGFLLAVISNQSGLGR